MIALQILLALTLGLAKASILPRQGGYEPPHCARSGEYIISNCGNATDPIQSILDTLYDALVKAVQHAQSDISSPAYRTFFKDPEFAGMVSDILSQAAAGAAIHPPNTLTDGRCQPSGTRLFESAAPALGHGVSELQCLC